MKDPAFWAALPLIITSLFTGILSLLTWWRTGHIGQRVEAIDAKVEIVKTQTDGLTKALVKSEKVVSHAEGVVEGKAIEKAENGGIR